MNRDRLEKELTRFEEEILSGLDKPASLPEHKFHLPAPPPFHSAPAVSMPEQAQFRPLLQAPPFQTIVDPSQQTLPLYTPPQPIQPVSPHIACPYKGKTNLCITGLPAASARLHALLLSAAAAQASALHALLSAVHAR